MNKVFGLLGILKWLVYTWESFENKFLKLGPFGDNLLASFFFLQKECHKNDQVKRWTLT